MNTVLAYTTLLFLTLSTSVVSAQGEGILPGLSRLTESNVRDSAIAFVNMTTSPGVDGAVVNVDNQERTSNQWRSSLGFSAEFTLKDVIFNGYWGLAMIGGRLEDKILLIDDDGRTVQLDLTREVVAARGTLGLSFPIDQHLKLRPFLSLIVSDLQSESVFDSQFVANNNLPSDSYSSRAQMWSSVISLDTLYNRWYGDLQLELSGQYNIIYTESFSEDFPVLDTEAWNDTLVLSGRINGPTDLVYRGRAWRWNSYAKYTNFLSHNKKALGYQSLLEVGTGLDWRINIKPLDWFGWQYVGFKAGLILGDNTHGYSIGLTAR